MAAGNQQKHLEFTLSIRALPFHPKASIRAHKHIFQYLKWLNCWKSAGEAFFQRDSIPIFCHALWKLGSSNCCSFEMKHATGLETCTRIYFLFIFNLVLMIIPKTSLFWPNNSMTSPWKPSISSCRVTNVNRLQHPMGNTDAEASIITTKSHRRTGNFLPGGALSHLPKKFSQVAQIFTKQ